MVRFLRSGKDRADLWLAQDGKCNKCGADLNRGWHADHIIPFKVSQTTKKEEMQALCPKCNLKKGSKVDYEKVSLVKFSSLDKARVGQIGGINCIIDKNQRGETPSAIEVATGVGKTDVIRTCCVELVDQGICCANLVVVPNTVLVDQMNNINKIKEWLDRFSVNAKKPIHFDRLDKFHINLFENGEYWIAMSCQMFCMNAEQLASFAQKMQKKTGLPMAGFF